MALEFGVFVQVTMLDGRGEDPALEHGTRTLGDMAVVLAAERAGFKYAWCAEHHCLPGYSHLSASEAFIAYALAKTERIHVPAARSGR